MADAGMMRVPARAATSLLKVRSSPPACLRPMRRVAPN